VASGQGGVLIDYAALDVAALTASYRSGDMSPVAAMERALAHRDASDGVLNAWASVLTDEAREAAARATKAFADGNDDEVLRGVPVAIKDLIDVRGVIPRFGSIYGDTPAAAVDAALVKRLRAAGAIVLGTTNMLEFAYGVAHPAVGQTNNPHDPARTSGGSSGGSAASVAAGTVPLAIGTDTGGSIRIPASYCGVVGFKPSFDLVPTQGVYPLSPSLDHAGPIARSVRDVIVATEVLSARSMGGRMPSPDKLRVGAVVEHVDSPLLTSGVSDSIQAAIERLREAGVDVLEVSVPDPRATNRALVQLLMPEASLVHADRYVRDPTRYAPRTRQMIEAGFRVTAVDHLRARATGRRLLEHLDDLFTRVDVLLSPSVPFVAPFEDPEFADDADDAELLSAGYANLAGVPAISLPCGFDGGLPVGLQLVGRRDADAALLAAALLVEKIVGGRST